MIGGQGIIFRIIDDLIATPAELDFDSVFGGRAMRRAAQNKVKNAIAKSLLSREIRRGDMIVIDPKMWKTAIVDGT